MSKQELQNKLSKEIIEGKIFVYPTDTVYGIGCNALIPDAVEKIREIKGRDNKPFSVIAPSEEWVLNHFNTNLEFISQYLPGKYTLILEKKDSSYLQHLSAEKTIGIRIPKHPFTEVIKRAGAPFITTSANISGKPPASEIRDIPQTILNRVDLVIDGGKLDGTPSTLIFPDGTRKER
jgi:L-threonylcarbamoyladenylate synthase